MTARERWLAILVAGLLVAVLLSWGWKRYRAALAARVQQLSAAETQRQQIQNELISGEYANRLMGEYRVRSLPSDSERAKSVYQQWLLELVDNHELSAATVSASGSRRVQDLYQRLEFRLQGRATMENFVALIHEFYSRDYLHRIRDFGLTPTSDGDFKVELSIDAIALAAAPAELPARDQRSWRVDRELASYHETILNRNFFEPPNQPPQYRGEVVLQTIRGRRDPIALAFHDPENRAMRYAFAEPPPEFVTLDSQQGVLRIDSRETQEVRVQIRATDSGYPPRSTEQTLTVRVVDPPAEPPPPTPEPTFDDASQTVLTALVQGREEWTAWMHVRTRGETLKLREGDQFKIGALQGSVVEVTARYVRLEVDGQQFQLKPADNLGQTATMSAPE